MANKKHIPLLEPHFFRETFIENLNKDMLNKGIINDFFIHSFREDVVKLKLPLPPHKKTVHDFVFIVNGEMTKSIGIDEFQLRANDFLFTPANQVTTTKRVHPSLEGFYCHFSDRFLADYPNLKFGIPDYLLHKICLLLMPHKLKTLTSC